MKIETLQQAFHLNVIVNRGLRSGMSHGAIIVALANREQELTEALVDLSGISPPPMVILVKDGQSITPPSRAR